MNKEQALSILKSAIDLAISKGAFPNIESISQIAQALQTIAKEIQTNN
jgi:hypothetical protein